VKHLSKAVTGSPLQSQHGIVLAPVSNKQVIMEKA